MRLSNAILVPSTLCVGLFIVVIVHTAEEIDSKNLWARLQPGFSDRFQKRASQNTHRHRPIPRRTPYPKQRAPSPTTNPRLSATDRELEFWVHRYMRWHVRNRHNATRVAMFLPVPHGLGDNLKGIVHMYGYAVLTKRLFLMDIGTNPLSLHLSHRAKSRFVYDPSTNEYGRRKQWAGRNIKTGWGVGFPWQARKLLIEGHRVVGLHVGIIPSPPEVQRSFGVNGDSPPFSLAVRRAITKLLLEPSAALNRTRQRVSLQLGLCDTSTECAPTQQHYIAVHARLGGIGEENEKRFRKLKDRYQTVARCLAGWVAQVAKKQNFRRPSIFLATDTQQFRELFNRTVGGNRVRWLDLEGTRLVHSSSTNSTRSHTLMQLDNLIIANSRHIVAFKSGFSDVAYWRGDARSFQTLWHHHCRIYRR